MVSLCQNQINDNHYASAVDLEDEPAEENELTEDEEGNNFYSYISRYFTIKRLHYFINSRLNLSY